jgi:hypothetical protein
MVKSLPDELLVFCALLKQPLFNWQKYGQKRIKFENEVILEDFNP